MLQKWRDLSALRRQRSTALEEGGLQSFPELFQWLREPYGCRDRYPKRIERVLLDYWRTASSEFPAVLVPEWQQAGDRKEP